jgi:hypothetical protein
LAYLKFENPETQRAVEDLVRKEPLRKIEVVRRWRWFGGKALRGDLESLETLLRDEESFLSSRRGRLAILPQSEEEKTKLESRREDLGNIWEIEEQG